ncbi:hypothetical protein LAZ67_19000506 [Cordylochernes scorpioides]|uniref:Uncharacterized protein n=1 Tax=Cordylochernes scorpioides TaxID=51811 RepID=A0ABY6LJS2_9ARAC|nr:hypothetical protein LAZ67_19000506 [Cordylochernes scorpioides]
MTVGNRACYPLIHRLILKASPEGTGILSSVTPMPVVTLDGVCLTTRERYSEKECRGQIKGQISLESQICKQKLIYFGHIMKANGSEKMLMLTTRERHSERECRGQIKEQIFQY